MIGKGVGIRWALLNFECGLSSTASRSAGCADPPTHSDPLISTTIGNLAHLGIGLLLRLRATSAQTCPVNVPLACSLHVVLRRLSFYHTWRPRLPWPRTLVDHLLGLRLGSWFSWLLSVLLVFRWASTGLDFPGEALPLPRLWSPRFTSVMMRVRRRSMLFSAAEPLSNIQYTVEPRMPITSQNRVTLLYQLSYRPVADFWEQAI